MNESWYGKHLQGMTADKDRTAATNSRKGTHGRKEQYE
jgi:hypothetical protein